ncbi:hypothetical protein H4R20_004822 [Coemansia guatemalensis]|uniref:B30.2/SPRY domain-containing protein n=1 Tax=Coemansia guatemalensis TaxID=2761395 RepID=A0A9W8HVH5_9FUNG|nr:hypothetical protein H4R20_004822 [Coemansia guatemalensis]
MTRAGLWSCLLAILGVLHTSVAVRAAGADSIHIFSGLGVNNPLARRDGSDESSDGDDALIILFILATAVCGALVGIGVVFVVFYTATVVVQRLRRFVYGLDEDGVSERVRNQLLTDEDSRQSYELGRAFERQYPYGSVNTQLTAEQQEQIREKGVDAWEFVVNVDVNAMLQSKTEVLFMGGENCVQTNLPLPKRNAVYYFEVKLVEKPMDVNMWIGLATRPYPAWRMTGWNKYSTGYCTNNGNVHQNSPFKAARIGERLFVGDILGIGYQPRSGVVWFTRNGRRYKEIVSGMLYDLFPTISADGPCSFSANFGQRGFVFIEANVKRWGLGPVEGAMVPPPVYGANQNTILLEMATSPSPSPSPSQAGVQILEQGGNAADAAVAVAAALGVTEPYSTGIGGDCFCLFYSAKDKSVKGLNGSGRAPGALTIERLVNELSKGGEKVVEIPPHNVHAVTVPGAAAGWVDTVEIFGSGKLALADILEPAIALAKEGFPVSELTAPFWRDGAEVLRSASPNGHELLIDGEGPQTGQIFRNPELANTLAILAKEGKDGFYRGPIADAIVQCIRDQGGTMSHDDLAKHTSTFEQPISYGYHGHRLYECAPNGGGLAALIALGIIDTLEKERLVRPIDQMDHNSSEYLHLIIEALRLAFADARRYVCDTEFGHVPVEQLLSAGYLSQRASLFDPSRAAANVKHGVPLGGSDTVYFSVVDQEGNACSFVNSLFHGFGSGIVPRGCGFALHDRGCLFSLDPSHANCLAPGKRPYHTIIPAMVTTATGELAMSYGIMGGYNQPQAHVQVLLNILRFGASPQRALDFPRICIQVDGDGHVAVEDGVIDAAVLGLRRRGHRVVLESGINRSVFGRGQVIRQLRDARLGTRVLEGGSDPRADGQAIGR